MKKRVIFLTAAAALFSFFVQAQNGITFGLRAGVNFQNVNGRDANDDRLDNEITTRFHGGVNVEIPVGTGFYLQPGALYSTKGAKLNGTSNLKLSYLEVPVNFVYKPALGTGKMIMGFGPYVAFGISGKYEPSGSSGGEIDVEFEPEVPANPPANKVYLRGIDAGANLLAGYEFVNKFSVQLNAQLGLTKINPDYANTTDNDTKWKNTGFGVSLGYRF